MEDKTTLSHVVSRVYALSEYDNKSVLQKALKLSEEVGEVSEAVLSLEGAPACGYKGLTEEDVMEELADVIIVALSLKHQINPDADITKFMEKKLNKWYDKLLEEIDLG